MKTPILIPLVVIALLVSFCGVALGQGKIVIGNDDQHLFLDFSGNPINQATGWNDYTLELLAGTSAGSLTLRTSFVGAAIGNIGFSDGRINNTAFVLNGIPAGAPAYFRLRMFETASGSYENALINWITPIFTVVPGVFTHASIVQHSPPSNSTWADGPVRVNCLDCVPPMFTQQPSSATVLLGGEVTLSARAYSGLGTPLLYEWRKDGMPMTGATNSSLILTNLALIDSGDYYVFASNRFGTANSFVAVVTVINPAANLSAPLFTSNNQFQFTVTGTEGSNYSVQVSTNLTTGDWISLLTNASPFTFVETNATDFPQRFYRALYAP